jgi:hypothetical protein
MTTILKFATVELKPARDAVLQNQSIPSGAKLPAGIEAIYTRAVDLLCEIAEPAGVLQEIAKSDFADVYHGEGRNEVRTPIGDIFGRIEELALFVATVGKRVVQEIDARFASGDYALGSMLDSAASAAADQLGAVAEQRFREILAKNGRLKPNTGVLRYSPGYCGWHISGQKKLFEMLRPEQVGVTLNDSFLMHPLKSVSGVLIAGPVEIHDSAMGYPACSECKTQGCRERILGLRAG